VFAGLALVSCGATNEGDIEVSHEAVALDDQEDEVCGMLVREQSAPRSQVVHRDGSRFFFCSLSDLLVHLDAPSPHGRADVTFVEVLDHGDHVRVAKKGGKIRVEVRDPDISLNVAVPIRPIRRTVSALLK